MSQELINHSPDLKQLRDEGFEVEVRSAFLLVSGVPYLDQNHQVKYGTLVSELTLAGDRTTKPGDHVIHFIGDQPCRKDGRAITSLTLRVGDQTLAEGLVVNRSFSNKPEAGYTDYHEKITRYIEIISAPVRSIDPSITAKTFNVIESKAGESVFKYLDTNSSRAEIDRITDKLKGKRIAIIGLGGTGSYILDLVAKTPVAEIHLFDGDFFLQHNAFRAPGAAAVDVLRGKSTKVEYFKEIYSRMHSAIVAHPHYIDPDNITTFEGFDFVFICIDTGRAKKALIESLEELGISFIDVGMGVEVVEDDLIAMVRTTASTPTQRKHIWEKGRISFAEIDPDDDYDSNIQIADLNALNATLAVIKWKKLAGFYNDVTREHHNVYTLNDNMLLNDDTET